MSLIYKYINPNYFSKSLVLILTLLKEESKSFTHLPVHHIKKQCAFRWEAQAATTAWTTCMTLGTWHQFTVPALGQLSLSYPGNISNHLQKQSYMHFTFKIVVLFTCIYSSPQDGYTLKIIAPNIKNIYYFFPLSFMYINTLLKMHHSNKQM